MIASLRGELTQRQPEALIVDVHGVGYEVFVSLNTYALLPPQGGSVRLDIHTHVREEEITLYGFLLPGEKRLFRLLIQVSGIGPRVALNVLSGLTPTELITAVVGGQVTRLTEAPGVGKRLAERLIVELKDKLAREALPDVDAPAAAAPSRTSPAAQVRDELIAALTVLGYRRAEIDRALQSAKLDGTVPVEALLRAALKELKPT